MKKSFATLALAMFAIVGGATPAYAKGCNGVVNLLVWGCAPWDNNNGEKFPYWRKSTVARTAPKGSEIKVKDDAAMVNINGTWYPVAGGAAAVVAAGGGNVVAAGGGNVVAAGGMNLRVVQPN